MHLAFVAFALVFSVTVSLGVRAAGLPDTGVSLCFNGMVTVSCSSLGGQDAVYPRQDARFGRDAKVLSGLTAKTGAGAQGFDYTKIANNGSVLPAGAALGLNPTDWACTLDNVTGLLWEVQRPGENYTYTWFSPDGATNGGDPGNPDTVGAGSDNCFDPTRCDTQKYVNDVNTGGGLCGRIDWRLPSRRELRTIAHLGAANLTIDTTYFPNTVAAEYWTSSTAALTPADAWYVSFQSGALQPSSKASQFAVRLVRGLSF